MNATIFAAVFMVAVSLFRTGALAQLSSSCTNALVSMSPYLNYIQGNSSMPSSSCCSELANGSLTTVAHRWVSMLTGRRESPNSL
ncbi:hypothetical protein V6N13_140347 [Hibiscus sabdariffa]